MDSKVKSPCPVKSEPVPRFVVGIDLGTTNSALCFIDTQHSGASYELPLEPNSPFPSDADHKKNSRPSLPAQQRGAKIHTFSIPQFVAANLIESQETLPSFHYQPFAGEFPEEMYSPLPGTPPPKGRKKAKDGDSRYFVGVLARDIGAKNPARMIASAKSWLSHSGVDRTAPLLPWAAEEGIEKHSPVEISAKYLEHLRNCWDAAHPGDPLVEQDIVLTLPASFDEVARELTISAAKNAGIPKLVLLEEPQAAFYAWMQQRENDRKDDFHLQAGQKILVIDVGGGTTDLTLIRVRTSGDGKLRFHRVAVGEHLILGGDNFDLTLAHHVQRRLVQEQRISKNEETEQGKKLPIRIWTVLVRNCCRLKELMLGKNAPQSTTLNLPGLGSKLIGGSMQIEITRKEVHDLLVEGFFPIVPFDAKPLRHASGFQEFGLPFAPDAAITKHLARFLEVHRNSGDLPEESAICEKTSREKGAPDPARPDMILFNGGVFESEILRRRLIEVLEHWFRGGEDRWSPIVLENPRLDLSVARGAAHYGAVRRGKGERISASLARTYYVGVEDSRGKIQAICMLPASVEPEHPIVLESPEFEMLIGTPVSFPLFVSSLRLTDQPGDVVEIEPEQLKALPPIKTVLKTRRKKQEMIRVRLRGRLSEIGTLELFAEEIVDPATRPRSTRKPLSWKLEFDVRSTTQTELEVHQSRAEQDGFFDESLWEGIYDVLRRTFNDPVLLDHPAIGPSEIVKKLVESSSLNREDWPTSLLRRIGQTLMEFQNARKLSAAHESRWLNLLGYAYRPGFGFALDDWRIDQFWKTIHGNLAHKSSSVSTQWWILLRRIAGGLSPGQQISLCEPILGSVRALHKQVIEGRGHGSDLDLGSQQGAEIWRMLGAMEFLPVEMKIELGDKILDLVPKKRMESVYDAMIWALGRLGARVLLSGPLNAIIPANIVEGWIRRRIESLRGKSRAIDFFAILELARKTDDPYRDISQRTRDSVLSWLLKENAPPHFQRVVEKREELDENEQKLLFGESLPIGLRIFGSP